MIVRTNYEWIGLCSLLMLSVYMITKLFIPLVEFLILGDVISSFALIVAIGIIGITDILMFEDFRGKK